MYAIRSYYGFRAGVNAAAERLPMDMAAKFQEQTVFHLTGKRASGELESIEPAELRPALLAAYRDLTRLRYDFPVVLVEGAAGGGFATSLSAVVNGVLQESYNFV